MLIILFKIARLLFLTYLKYVNFAMYFWKKEISYKEGILKDIGAHGGYTALYWKGGYLSGGTSLDTPCGRYTRVDTNTTEKGL